MSGHWLFENDFAAREFSAGLATRALGRALVYARETSSTNNLAMQRARDGAAHGTVCIADAQSSGRGRRGRAWESPPGTSLLFSVVIDTRDVPAQRLSWAALAAGLAGAAGIARTTSVASTLKWPNDIVLPESAPRAGSPGWRKLGGVLCESALSGQTSPGIASGFAILGIGLNINQHSGEMPELTKAPPTSVLMESGVPADRLRVLAAVLEELEARLELLRSDNGCGALFSEADAALRHWWTPQRMLEVQSGLETSPLCGRYSGLNAHGWLRLREKNGTERVLPDGEVLAVRAG
jgi:BirA family transcriptional regulator, biotin operon repressor / biotin---[acetyl-CoA-carboxylase] ligase